MSHLRVLIAEDHETVREGLKLIIDAQPDMKTIAEAGDGDRAVALAHELKPDVVVMDISMPGLNGSKATKKITEGSNEVRVVALTRHTESGYVQDLLRAGATGYVLKQSSSEELIRAIRAVGRGKSYLDPAVTTRVVRDYVVKESGRPPADSNRRLSLTDRETEVLKLIASGYTNKEIAARLEISVKTVEAHKANSMKKLGLTSRIDVVNYALLRGWLGTN